MPVSSFARLLATSAAAVAVTAFVATFAPTAHAAQAGPVCLDTTNSRADNTNVRLWSCLNHPNQ
ncbi:hypothetical protein ACFQ08_14795, partial [Streptosporangium algeriense]